MFLICQIFTNSCGGYIGTTVTVLQMELDTQETERDSHNRSCNDKEPPNTNCANIVEKERDDQAWGHKRRSIYKDSTQHQQRSTVMMMDVTTCIMTSLGPLHPPNRKGLLVGWGGHTFFMSQYLTA